MLSFALLLSAALSNPVKLALTPAPAAIAVHPPVCPTANGTPFVANPQLCPALDVSGRADPSGVTLNPAFEVMVPPGHLANSSRADAELSGYSADGHTLFTFPFAANGPFHIYMPLAPQVSQALTRLYLTTGANSVEQVPLTHGEPDAEVIAVDGSHVLLAWNAHVFPAVRIFLAPGTSPIAIGSGRSTYQELTFSSTSRHFVIDFSDGIHSATRTFHVFGRT